MTEKPSGADKDSRDLDAEADELLQHIESQTGSMYAVHAGGEAEDLDPGNLHPDELDRDDSLAESLAHGIALDEPAEGLDAERQAQEAGGVGENAGARQEEQPKGHRGLKAALVIVIVVLVAVVCAIGYLVWQSNAGVSASPQAEQSDTAAMQTASSGPDKVDFAEIDQSKVPELSKVFGMKLADAKKEIGSQLDISGSGEKASDKRVKSLVRMAEGEYLDESGNKLCSVGLGLDKSGRVVYAYALYNLDDIGVESATFAELVMNNVVGTSILEGLGVDEAKLGTPKLASGDDTKEEASYKGSTQAKKAPKTWELVESYTYSSGATAARTLTAELY